MSAGMAAAPLGAANAGQMTAGGARRRSSAEVEALGARIAGVRAAIGRVIFGQDEVVDQTLITLLSGGHVAAGRRARAWARAGWWRRWAWCSGWPPSACSSRPT